MPGRRGRSGGKRQGQVGRAYPNRGDLNGAQPITPTSGGQYGSRKASIESQRAVPVGTPEVAPAAPGFTGPPAGMAAPGSMGDLFADSTNPDEDVMNGASLGPGAPPEAFGLGPAAELDAALQWARPYLPAMAAAARTDPALQAIRLLKSRLSFGPGD